MTAPVEVHRFEDRERPGEAHGPGNQGPFVSIQPRGCGCAGFGCLLGLLPIAIGLVIVLAALKWSFHVLFH